MATTIRPRAARLAIAIALLAQLQTALASFYTVTSYYVLTLTTTPLYSTCTTNTCRMYTDTDTLTVKPTVTPTATPLSSTTYTYTYDDLEVVRLYLAANAVDSSDLLPTSTTRQSGIYTQYAVPVTWTAPSSCPTPFTVATISDVYLPYQVTAYLSAQSTATSYYTYARTDSTVTYITYIIPQSAVPASVINPTSNYYYSNYVRSCRNPTATGGAAYYGPTYTARPGSGGSSGGGSGSSSDWDDWTVCSALTGCVALATWVIVVATILPALFLFGFIESYIWFRRMMTGKSALRLGTVCWCCLSLWFILLTRRSKARTPADQVLLKQYWATLGAGARIKLWFKWGFRWKYPVELLGNPDGNNPVVQAAAAAVPPPGGFPPPDGTNGAEKLDPNGPQPMVYMPYPVGPDGQQQQQYPPYQPYPGQQPYPYPPQPGFPQQQPPLGYMMAPPQPQPAYIPGQPQPAPYPGQQQQAPYPGQQQHQQAPYPAPSTPGTVTTATPPPQSDQQQPMFQSYAPGGAPSPVQTAASELHSEPAGGVRGTPPPQGMGTVAEAPAGEVQTPGQTQTGQTQQQQQQQQQQQPPA